MYGSRSSFNTSIILLLCPYFAPSCRIIVVFLQDFDSLSSSRTSAFMYSFMMVEFVFSYVRHAYTIPWLSRAIIIDTRGYKCLITWPWEPSFGAHIFLLYWVCPNVDSSMLIIQVFPFLSRDRYCLAHAERRHLFCTEFYCGAKAKIFLYDMSYFCFNTRWINGSFYFYYISSGSSGMMSLARYILSPKDIFSSIALPIASMQATCFCLYR